MIRGVANSLFIRRRKVIRSSDSVVRNPSDGLDLERELVDVDIRSSGSDSSGGDVEIVVVRERIIENRDSPPVDDVCPICFGDFTIPFQTNCGHWFCGSCFLRFWNHKPSLRKCKCPMCSQLISKLTPAACLSSRQEKEVIDILKNVHNYNCLFQGGVRGLLQNVFSLPLLSKRLLQGLMDPDRFTINFNTARCIGLMLGLMYQICPLDFIPIERHTAHSFFELCATSLVALFCLVGLCRRAILVQRTRRLVAAIN